MVIFDYKIVKIDYLNYKNFSHHSLVIWPFHIYSVDFSRSTCTQKSKTANYHSHINGNVFVNSFCFIGSLIGFYVQNHPNNVFRTVLTPHAQLKKKSVWDRSPFIKAIFSVKILQDTLRCAGWASGRNYKILKSFKKHTSRNLYQSSLTEIVSGGLCVGNAERKLPHPTDAPSLSLWS